MTTSSHKSIHGIWFVSDLPDGIGILVIRDDRRVIQFPSSITKPRMNQTLRLWYSDYDGSNIIFRSQPDSNGWQRRLEHTESGFIMHADQYDENNSFLCTPANLTELPDWFDELLQKNLCRMDTLDSHSQN